ncbi:MAG: glycosyltransferase family 2 protein [Vulcanimicrobiaceae bacterium]
MITRQYPVHVGESIIRVDLSRVGTAIVELEAQHFQDVAAQSVLTQMSSRILSSLSGCEFAASIVIPLYNEASILSDLVPRLIEEFSEFPFLTEFLLCENGSQDMTREIASRFAEEHANVRMLTIDSPSYGAAIRAGIEAAQADLVVIFNADLWCKHFFFEAVLLLQAGYDMVIGSKCLISSNDQRPAVRRWITWSFNVFLKFVFGFRGTDTHGMKALRRSKCLPVMRRCYTSKEVFDTELVLKAQRANLRMCEVPTEVHDTRPARLSILRRIPSTIRDLIVIRRTVNE